MLLLLIPLALALVVVSLLGLAGIGPLTVERRAGRGGVMGVVGPALGLVIGGGLCALAVIGSLLLVGIDGESSDNEDSVERGALSTSTTGGRPTAARPPRERTTASRGPDVTVEAESTATFPATYDVADDLEPETVLQVHARGFEPFARAVAEQCSSEASPRCGNAIPVQFDADGQARFQYLVTDAFYAAQPIRGGCRADAPPCVLVVQAIDSERRGEIQTVFVDSVPPPGRITVTPARELSLEGETVTVEVRDYPADTTVNAMVCAAPDAVGPRCGGPGATTPVVVGADGTGRARLHIEPGRVGSLRARCARGDDCGVSVASTDVFARAPVVPISFAAPPGAAYDATRLAWGLGIAGLLVLIAAGLIVRTNWSPVGEAAAPEIDDAEYADLDAIIAALPPEEDELASTR